MKMKKYLLATLCLVGVLVATTVNAQGVVNDKEQWKNAGHSLIAESEKMDAEDSMTVKAENFKGNDIHDLVPLYINNNYNIISGILPANWTKIYFYTEDNGVVSNQLGYVVIGDRYIPLEDLPKYKYCSPKLYEATMNQLKLWSNYFRTAFADHKMEPWTVFSYSLDREGNIRTDFEYIDLAEQKYSKEHFDLWSYKNLGIRDNLVKDMDLTDITPANVYIKLK